MYKYVNSCNNIHNLGVTGNPSAAITIFEMVTSNTTVSLAPLFTTTGIKSNETSSDDLEKELEAASTKAEILMLELVTVLEEIPEIVR